MFLQCDFSDPLFFYGSVKPSLCEIVRGVPANSFEGLTQGMWKNFYGFVRCSNPKQHKEAINRDCHRFSHFVPSLNQSLTQIRGIFARHRLGMRLSRV